MICHPKADLHSSRPLTHKFHDFVIHAGTALKFAIFTYLEQNIHKAPI